MTRQNQVADKTARAIHQGMASGKDYAYELHIAGKDQVHVIKKKKMWRR